MNTQRMLGAVRHFVVELWMHHGFVVVFERIPAWGKIVLGITSAALVAGGFVVVRGKRLQLGTGDSTETWVKQGDKVTKAISERSVRMIEISLNGKD